jgi:SAM-dependent methyltransferase
MAERLTCPACGADEARPVAELGGVPVYCNVLWPTPEEALAAPRGDVALAFCGSCGMVWNSRFDQSLVAYTPAYENSLDFSSVFRAYAAELASRLVERYGLEGKDIVEIGSGKGDFLALLCAGGRNRGVGFDPSYDGEADAAAPTVHFVRDLYSEAYADTPADFVCCRHVLEHIEEPRTFLAALRRTLDGRDGAVVYFEVPAAEYVLSQLSLWDVIYEHCSLFSAPALRRLFEATGFEVLELGFSYGGQYLWVEARPAKPTLASSNDDGEVEAVRRLADGFERGVRGTLERSRSRVAELAVHGPLALWGAGSKGVTFLNLVAPPRDGASLLVVDVNPRKQGRHVAGRGDRIVAPEELRSSRARSILVMNPLYRDEIEQMVRALDLDAEVVLA